MNEIFEKHNFIKIINNDKKIVVRVRNIKNNNENVFSFNYETNIIYDIPNTNTKIALACENYILFFVSNVKYGVEGDSSCNRAFYEGLSDTYNFCNYVYNNEQPLKIYTQDDYYIEISIITNSNNNQDKNNDENKELLRVQCRTNGFYIIMPPKRDFVFFYDRLEIYKKNRLKEIIKYSDIDEIHAIKTWQNNLFIKCDPIGVMLYKINDKDISRIKEIISTFNPKVISNKM